jgi:hypothetical protein
MKLYFRCLAAYHFGRLVGAGLGILLQRLVTLVATLASRRA